MSTGMRVGAGSLAALFAGMLCIPLVLGAGKPNQGGWDDACGSTVIEIAADTQTIPPATPGGQVTVPLNPQGRQTTPSWNSSQQRWAGIITHVARSRGLPPRAAVIGVATAMQESTLENIDFGDRDSLGLFQQRPSQGWGTPAQVTDAVYASNSFYKGLEKIENWQTKPLAKVAQAVQRSGFPDAYAKWEQSSGELVVKSWGNAVLTTTSGCDPARTAVGKSTGAWALPVENSRITTPYKAGGGFWSSGSHTGIDFPVPTGTRIQAVGTGTVVKAGWGGAYGNEVVIKMSDGTYTQYAHLSSMTVTQGQAVTARRQIGVSGATGNVTGPHLHFETRTGPAYGSDISPVDYLRSRGLSL
ncbi:M23 family metallopeptidase [Streptomyces zhihengii]|uniref:M23 family metallopeptidase n=1 Tax=Streptomyces zhihengii TaxID=1818004 RepID=A0ABS2V4K8_9ACTN|nr:M23 family metallopeptidase [Streptomyces zhihengii]MBM9623955.1 M23 family metallopeptidase [Streptomyces zhihengii]